ncbi:MAG: HPr family phosphocarrier protein [Gammaproteobacteria bacterium]|nr:HPr family phosphocarrier protein [Gammaproteobacteria bacterium]MDH5801539.1 HPr family phosphocarrier protein [Gammaproteobacteria bacterium]
MLSTELTIVNKLGLHARAAAKLVQLASRFQSSVFVSKDGREVNGKSIMGVMMLAASQNSIITVTVDGADEYEALSGLQQLVEERFGEDE